MQSGARFVAGQSQQKDHFARFVRFVFKRFVRVAHILRCVTSAAGISVVVKVKHIIDLYLYPPQ